MVLIQNQNGLAVSNNIFSTTSFPHEHKHKFFKKGSYTVHSQYTSFLFSIKD